MSETRQNKITKLQLENFTCFSKAELEFSPGINIFIGENGMGKTHVLKVLYGLPKQWDQYNEKKHNRYFLSTYFGVEEPGKLIRIETANTQVKLSFSRNYLEIVIGEQVQTMNIADSSDFSSMQRAIFFPYNEMLSWQNGFINLYANKEIGLDETYYDLAINLNGNLLKGEAKEKADKLKDEIEKNLGISVFKRDDRFYITFNREEKGIEAPLAATGINKLAQIIYLIMNGSISGETALFWDEPEANLNPRYIKLVAGFLKTLANAGCQIFVATHDYLLVHLLSQDAEYRDVQENIPDMRFFSFFKGKDGTEVEWADTAAGLEHNTILDEYAAYYENEEKLFKKSLKTNK